MVKKEKKKKYLPIIGHEMIKIFTILIA